MKILCKHQTGESSVVPRSTAFDSKSTNRRRIIGNITCMFYRANMRILNESNVLCCAQYLDRDYMLFVSGGISLPLFGNVKMTKEFSLYNIN